MAAHLGVRSRNWQFTDAGARPEQSLSVEAHAAPPTFMPLREPERRCGTLRRYAYEITFRRSLPRAICGNRQVF